MDTELGSELKDWDIHTCAPSIHVCTGPSTEGILPPDKTYMSILTSPRRGHIPYASASNLHRGRGKVRTPYLSCW